MLRELHIKNFTIIESAQAEFQSGLTIISGETGAGKSILAQALSFALGARADAELLRSGAPEASVSAIFESKGSSQVHALLEEMGVVLEEDTIILRRTLNQAGRSRAFLNDQSVTLKTLQTLGATLVHQVGQHAAQKLLEEEFLLNMLDGYGKHEALLSAYTKAYQAYQSAHAELKSLQDRIASVQEQEEFLRFQFEELKNANLKAGEEAELESQKQRLKHRVSLASHAQEIHQILSEGDQCLSDQFAKVVNLAEKTKQWDASTQTWSKSLTKAQVHLDEIAVQVQDYARDLQEDPEAFDEVETRLAQIHELKRKYRLEEAGLIAKQAELEQQLGELEDFEMTLSEKKSLLEQAKQNLINQSKKLHQSRKKHAESISQKLISTLKDLALPHTKVVWKIESYASVEEFKLHGGDKMVLLISFNPGEELRPFEEIISGGELSRLLLALYEILFPAQCFGSFMFDEVDTGVSGGVAELMGRKLKNLSTTAQVFCITHLPQIACQGEWHFVVLKEVKKNRTYSKIDLLNEEERVQEIARMLAGVDITDQAISHAQELLNRRLG